LRTGARLLWLWLLPSPRAWSLQLSAQPRAIGIAGSSDRDLLTIRPPAQSARPIPERLVLGGAAGGPDRNPTSRAVARSLAVASNLLIRTLPRQAPSGPHWCGEAACHPLCDER
jgi:hypothetical protein